MLLNMAMIAQGLGDAVAFADVSSDASAMTLSHAELACEGVEPLEDVVYLYDARKDPPAAPEGGRLRLVAVVDPGGAGGCGPSGAGAPGVERIEVAGLALPELLARVQRVFRRYAQWDDALKAVMMRGGLVADLLDASVGLFSSNILVHDRDMRVIAYRTHGGSRGRSPLDDLAVDRPMSGQVATTFNSTVAANAPGVDPFSIRGPHFWTSANGPQCLSMNVFHGERFLARVVLTTLDYDEEPTAGDVVPFVTLCSYIESVLQLSCAHLLGGAEDAFTGMLAQVMRGLPVAERDLRAAARARGWDYYNDRYLLLAVEMGAEGGRHLSHSYPLIAVFNLTAELLGSTHTFVFEGRGMVLVDLTRSGASAPATRRLVERIADENGCAFCCGRPVTGLRGLAQAHREALQALALRPDRRGGPPARVVTIDDVALALVDRCVAEAISPLTFCPEGLLAIIRHDNAHRSEIYRTLRVYVEQNCSPSRSAKLLYVQRSTFLYRLRKAQELLGMDLADPEAQVRLRLSFRLLDALSARELAAI